VALANRPVTALAATDDGWLAIVDRHTTVDDTGRLHADIPGATATCVAGDANGALVGTDDAGLLRVDGDRAAPVAGFAGAEGRSNWYTPWGGPPSTRSVTVAADGTPFVNVHVGGILRSRDEGRTWQQTIDIDVDVHQVLADPAGGLFAACGVGGLAHSRDGGASWRFHTAGLHATYCRAVAVAGEMVLISAALGPRGGRAAVYRRPLHRDGGFERCEGGLPPWFDANIDTHHLACRDHVAALASADGRVFVSHDAGASWDEADRTSGVAAVAVL
jgi:hypothetical protein